MKVPNSVSTLLFCLAVALISLAFTAKGETDRIKLSDLKSIVLRRDNLTTGRRSTRIPQLRCVGNMFKCQNFAPDTVECFNKGSSGFDTQWDCQSDMDKRVRFGMIKVSCEGYDHPNDEYILAGSCGLEYTIESSRTRNYYEYYNKDMYETNKLSNFLTMLIMIIIIVAVYKSCNKNRDNDLFRREFNSAYAQLGIVESAATNADSGYLSSLAFPPPPPPYGQLVTSTTTEAAAAHSPHSAEINQTATSTHQTQQANTSASEPKPEQLSEQRNAQSASSSLNHTITAASAAQAPIGGWANFLNVNGVTGFLLNRRNTNPNLDWSESTTTRTESPPPSYEDHNSLSRR